LKVSAGQLFMNHSQRKRLPSGVVGSCWYCAENTAGPISTRSFSNVATGSRWGNSALLRRRRRIRPKPLGIASSAVAMARQIEMGELACPEQIAGQVALVQALLG
jgi:hypothetical protein